MNFFREFWPTGVMALMVGIVLSEFFGYAYHRWVLHAMLMLSKKCENGAWKSVSYLFVPWKMAYEKHAWHHFILYPEPAAPGAPHKSFRPKHTYYNGEDIAPHVFGREPSKNIIVDRLEYLLCRVGMIFTLDWFIYASAIAVLAYLVIPDHVVFAWFALGMLLNGAFNQFIHDSFHVRPYVSLGEVPFRHWFKPEVALANLGAHLPGFRSGYRILFIRHIAHHYDVVKPDDGNYRYDGALLNAQRSNFTMYSIIPDLVFGSYNRRIFNAE